MGNKSGKYGSNQRRIHSEPSPRYSSDYALSLKNSFAISKSEATLTVLIDNPDNSYESKKEKINANKRKNILRNEDYYNDDGTTNESPKQLKFGIEISD
ncbi:unnamed protein product [Brachionus calyciflorus]|uniref:Uncharacterized protein n=1 Tax=Brachionus calyciflorus TaxID=104777 RepID=A0A814P440_9BILA|nr:unnamed protein product [Brachionus calyciflorus]